jgi:ABC-type glucose/galactose transport system permease subunit
MKGNIIARGENALGRVDPATIGPGLALLAMIVVFSTLSPYFLTRTNVTNVLVQSAPLLILATGQTFDLLMGGLDLSQGSIVSLSQCGDGGRYDAPSYRTWRSRRARCRFWYRFG